MTVAPAQGFRNPSDHSLTFSASFPASEAGPRTRGIGSTSIHQLSTRFNYVIPRGDSQFEGEVVDPLSYSSFYDSINPQKTISIACWTDPGKLFVIKTIEKLGETNLGKSFRASFAEKPVVYKVYRDPQNLPLLREAVWNYTGFRRIGFPVPIHYDLEDLMKNSEFREIYESSDVKRFDQFVSQNVIHGYHFSEFCYSFPSCEKAGELIKENKLTETQCKELYSQLKEMFKILYKRKILANLNIENTGIIVKTDSPNANNPVFKVVYLDPTYVCKLSDPKSFDQAIEELLKTFAPRETDLYNFLNPIPPKAS